MARHRSQPGRRRLGDDPDIGGLPGLGVERRRPGLHEGDPPGDIELDDDEALALVQVDGTGVHLAECPRPVDGAEEDARGGIDDLVRLPPERPQVQFPAGRLPPAPVQPCLPGRPNLAFGQVAPLEHPGGDRGGTLAERLRDLRRRQGQLVGGAAEVRLQDAGIGHVHERGFEGSREQDVRVREVVLVQRVLMAHQHRRRLLARPPGTPRLLPHLGNGAGEPVHHDGIEAPDVDAELQGGRCGDAQELP